MPDKEMTMNQHLQTFIRVGLSADGAAALHETRDGFKHEPTERVAELRESLHDLIEHRRLSLREWSMINDMDFDDEDALYAYLREAYGYLFEGAETPPAPPWW